MWFRHSMNIVQQLMPIYNTTVHKNKSFVAFNVFVRALKVKNNNTPLGRGAESISKNCNYTFLNSCTLFTSLLPCKLTVSISPPSRRRRRAVTAVKMATSLTT